MSNNNNILVAVAYAVPTGMSSQKVIKTNLLVAGLIPSMEICIAACSSWLHANPSLTPRDLQDYIHKIGARIQLISRVEPLRADQRYFSHGVSCYDNFITSELSFAVGSLDFRMKQALKYHRTLEENYKALTFSGGVCDLARFAQRKHGKRMQIEAFTMKSESTPETFVNPTIYDHVVNNRIYFKMGNVSKGKGKNIKT